MNTETPLLKGIKNIIFDLGNVIVDIDFKRTVDAFARLAGTNIDLNLDNYMDHPVFGAIEKGQISTSDFRDEIRHMLNKDISDIDVDAAWAAVIINSDMKRINLIKELGQHYKLYILSNTDEIHITRVIQLFKDNFDVDFTSLFEKCYYSHELGMEKPNDDIYLDVLKNATIKPEETLFIDDRLDNIEASLALGIKSYHLIKGKETLVEMFS